MFDPLAHLRLTTGAYVRATRLLDAIAHEWCEGRWLATGGGGYDAYRVVPRSWALVWLAQAHRDVPEPRPRPRGGSAGRRRPLGIVRRRCRRRSSMTRTCRRRSRPGWGSATRGPPQRSLAQALELLARG